MAEIILTVVVASFVSQGLAIWLLYRWAKFEFLGPLSTFQHNQSVIHGKVEDVLTVVESVESVLKEASRLKAVRESVFEGDKIPDRPGKMSYIPVARRRAAAEFASLSPKTHEDKVRENNARAIESAG